MPERVIQSRKQEVLPGTHEYILLGQLLSTDYTGHLEMIFDQDLVIEDLILSTVLDGGASVQAGPLKLLYPSGSQIEISSSTSDYTMNQDNDSRNLWYAVPVGTRLRWSPYNQYAADVLVSMSVIGRSL